MHYFDIKSSEDLLIYVQDDFNNKDYGQDITDENGIIWRQIGGKTLPQGNMWRVFKTDLGYACGAYEKCGKDNDVLPTTSFFATGETFQEMLDNFVTIISKFWSLK